MDLVQLMGGRVYLDLNLSVTHLIAGEVGSKKYLVAASLSKPILLPTWVKACWEKSQDRYTLIYIHMSFILSAYHSFPKWLNCWRILYFLFLLVYIYVHHINIAIIAVVVKVITK